MSKVKTLQSGTESVIPRTVAAAVLLRDGTTLEDYINSSSSTSKPTITVNIANSFSLQSTTLTSIKDSSNTVIASKYGVSTFTQQIPSFGTYTVVARSGNYVFTETVEVSSVQNYTVNVGYVLLTVTCPVSSIVTATSGSYTATGKTTSSSTSVTLYLPHTGVYSITCTNGTSTATGTVNATSYGTTYTITLSYIDTTVTFANSTWDNVIAVCDAGKVGSTSWVVGNTKTLSINGTNYDVVIIGINHDDLASGSGKAPLTIQLKECLNTTYPMNSSNTNAGGWTNCLMRTSTMATLLTQLPTVVQNGIKQVTKKTSAGSQSSTINTTTDKLFLLSEIEIFGSTSYSKSGEGSQYAYYSAGNSKVKKVNGSAYFWWERSPYGDYSTYFCRVSGNGGASASSASDSNGVSFCFCI